MNANYDMLNEIKKSAVFFKTMRRTEPKSPLIKKVLLKALDGINENESLPSIRSIAKTLGTAVLPVHKAITELKDEGVIIAKSTSGFLKAYPPSPKYTDTISPNMLSTMYDFVNINLKFAVESTEAYQRSFWQKIVNSEYFNTKNPFVNIEMVFKSLESLKNTMDYNIDIVETNPFAYYKYKLKDTFLNIKDYLAFDNDQTHIALFDNQLITSYYQTFFVFYNSDFLEKNNLPEPEFKNFDEQEKYFNLMNNESERFDIDFFMGACIPPIIYLGKYFNDLINFLNTNVKSSKQEDLFEDILNQTLKFCSLFDYKSHSSKDKSMNIYFEEGSMPFLAGSSEAYWRLLSLDVPFKWKAYPLFSIDGLCIKHPIYTGIIQKTEDPLNAFQFLSFLLDDKVQKKFTEIGLVPVNLDLFNIECLTKEQNEFFKECYKKVELLKLTSYPQFYVQNFIFSPQLLEKAMNHKKQNYNLKRIFHLARTYFASHHA